MKKLMMLLLFGFGIGLVSAHAQGCWEPVFSVDGCMCELSFNVGRCGCYESPDGACITYGSCPTQCRGSGLKSKTLSQLYKEDKKIYLDMKAVLSMQGPHVTTVSLKESCAKGGEQSLWQQMADRYHKPIRFVIAPDNMTQGQIRAFNRDLVWKREREQLLSKK